MTSSTLCSSPPSNSSPSCWTGSNIVRSTESEAAPTNSISMNSTNMINSKINESTTQARNRVPKPAGLYAI